MKSFCENHDLKYLFKKPACFKNPRQSTCADLILTNIPESFQKHVL